jgi:tetratricopeptide (TPR) repeat protein
MSGHSSAHDDQHGGPPSERLGHAHFTTSCDPSIEQPFDRAVALLHSFWFDEAIKSFKRVLEIDPRCAMAYWGIALSHHGYRGQEMARRAGLAAVEQAEAALNEVKTQREKDYIAAVAFLYEDAGTLSPRARALAYEKAMARLTRNYPDDREALLFYALAILDTVVPTDKTHAVRLRAGAILEKEFQTQPDHPGTAHYIIHAYDVPPLADRALPAARRYAQIAPAAAHALHMPSHTFTRLGLWEESIATNIDSGKAAQAAGSPGEYLHALDYEAYAYLQTAQDLAASRIVAEVPAIARGRGATPAYGSANFFAVAAIPARYALERHAWAEATTLQPNPSSMPYTEAMTHFTRALGFARTSNPTAAQKEFESLTAAGARLVDARDLFWSEQVEIHRMVARAWILLAQGHADEALRTLRTAVDREDATEKSATTPGPLLPARELLGDMLLELKQPEAALQEYEASNKKEPNRFWGLYGAARAAELSGHRDQARQYYERLLTVCRSADRQGRPELTKALAVVSSRLPGRR